MWSIEWSRVSERDVLQFPSWRLASDVCEAVFRFAQYGRGNVELMGPDDPNMLRIRVHGAAAICRIDVPTRTLFVFRVYPTIR